MYPDYGLQILPQNEEALIGLNNLNAYLDKLNGFVEL